jgi:mono/diheme cytochrome c family protein
MAVVWRNSLQYLTEADAKAMATYLESLPPAGALGSGRPPAQSKAYVAGAKLFVENCAPCHGSTGAGQPDLAPPLAGNPVAIAPSPNNLISIVLGGQVAQHGSMEMPNFRATATDAEIADVATYVRGAWGNEASPVSPEAVAAIRKAAARK